MNILDKIKAELDEREIYMKDIVNQYEKGLTSGKSIELIKGYILAIEYIQNYIKEKEKTLDKS